MKNLFLISITYSIITLAISSSSIVCPTIGCDADIGDRVCFLHSASNPVSYIRMYQCPANYICDIKETSKYAWVNSNYQ